MPLKDKIYPAKIISVHIVNSDGRVIIDCNHRIASLVDQVVLYQILEVLDVVDMRKVNHVAAFE